MHKMLRSVWLILETEDPFLDERDKGVEMSMISRMLIVVSLLAGFASATSDGFVKVFNTIHRGVQGLGVKQDTTYQGRTLIEYDPLKSNKIRVVMSSLDATTFTVSQKNGRVVKRKDGTIFTKYETYNDDNGRSASIEIDDGRGFVRVDYETFFLLFTNKTYPDLADNNAVLPSKYDSGKVKASLLPVPLTDERDGHVYQTVVIGDQKWMKQNLNYTSDESWCYDNDSSKCAVYGRLYSWSAAQHSCPSGWHLPTNAEWSTLLSSVGGTKAVAPQLKMANAWARGGNNESGFSALPAGILMNGNGNQGFAAVGQATLFWSASAFQTAAATSWGVNGGNDSIDRYNFPKPNGFSVRCVEDVNAPGVNAVGDMIHIPAGTFIMGSYDEGGTQMPVRVSVSAFSLDRTAVTNKAYASGGLRAFHYTDESCFTSDPETGNMELGDVPESFRGEDQPVVCVNWKEADSYCRSIGKRLPTEAEFEYATRAGTMTPFFWGNDSSDGCDYANGPDQTPLLNGNTWNIKMECLDGYGEVTAPVGSFRSNHWGLYDMAGNVSQWINDWYSPNYYEEGHRQDPQGPASGTMRVVRGGDFMGAATIRLRSAHRGEANPKLRAANFGFRCAEDIASTQGK